MVSREAAVLALLREGSRGPEVLLIRRSQREDDPWSGQMALPGGRAEPEDLDRKATALRETEEEIGVTRHELQAEPEFVEERQPGNRPDLVVSVYRARLRPGAEGRIRTSAEVAATLWVPLLEGKVEHRTVDLPMGRGRLEVEGLVWGEVFVWGLTYRILARLNSPEPEGPRP